MDNSTIKEIRDVVFMEVMKAVQSSLSEIKPELIESITAAAAARAKVEVIKSTDLTNNVEFRKLRQEKSILENHVAMLESRVAKLEAQLVASSSSKPKETVQEKAVQKPASAVNGINTLSSDQIDDILSYQHYYREAKGWIYYIKVIKKGYDGYGELYKVKPDGTQNQKIFAEKVSTDSIDVEFDFNVKGDKLTFVDNEGNDRVIRI